MSVIYRYLTGEEWGIVYAQRVGRTEFMPDPEGTLHHSAGNSRHTTDAKIVFREFNKSELDKGYWCVRYDILVHEQVFSNGHRLVTIGEGRGPWMSGATLDRNEQSEAVLAMGYFHPGHSLSEHPSEYMLEGLARGFAWGIKKGWIATNPNIYGHRDNPSHPNATACPGDYLWPHLPTIRTRVTELMHQEEEIMHAFVPKPADLDPRILDTRGPPDNFDAYKVAPNIINRIVVPGAAGKTHAFVNLGAVHGVADGFLQTWAGSARPVSSSLNFVTSKAIANGVLLELNADGTFNLLSNQRVHVFIDLVGYFQPL